MSDRIFDFDPVSLARPLHVGPPVEVAPELPGHEEEDELTTADLREAFRHTTGPWAAECIRGALRDRGVIV